MIDIKTGWICPLCGRGVAPDVDVCPCRDEMFRPLPSIDEPPSQPFVPVFPWPNPTVIYGPTDPIVIKPDVHVRWHTDTTTASDKITVGE